MTIIESNNADNLHVKTELKNKNKNIKQSLIIIFNKQYLKLKQNKITPHCN